MDAIMEILNRLWTMLIDFINAQIDKIPGAAA